MHQLSPGVPEYFFDDLLIGYQRRLVRRWLPARVFPEPVLQPDRPWEGRILALYGSVLPNPGGGYRMYYSNFVPGGRSVVCMAASRDGFRWEKPDLGMVEWEGSRANNIIIRTDGHLDSPSVIADPADAAYPFKMMAFQTLGASPMWAPDWGMYAWRSRDGLKWEMLPGVRLPTGDRNSFYKDSRTGRYVLLTRDKDQWERAGGRHIARSESADFLTWSAPELILNRDLDDEPDIEFYGMPVFLRNGWYFGLLEYWDGAHDRIEVHLALSRDGRSWRRPLPRRPFIAATHDWNRAWSSCANNGPIVVNEQMVFHFGGRWVSHHFDSAQQWGVIGYASLALDRFCGLEAAGGGRLETVPLAWPGGDLAINAETRQSFESHPAHCNGELAVEVLDADGKALPEWSGGQKAVFRGNTHCRAAVQNQLVRWPGDRSLDACKGCPIRLRFDLQHARLFTIEARG